MPYIWKRVYLASMIVFLESRKFSINTFLPTIFKEKQAPGHHGRESDIRLVEGEGFSPLFIIQLVSNERLRYMRCSNMYQEVNNPNHVGAIIVFDEGRLYLQHYFNHLNHTNVNVRVKVVTQREVKASPWLFYQSQLQLTLVADSWWLWYNSVITLDLREIGLPSM